MPPPRLPRHLRPCHPLGTAHQIRCAHRTTSVQSSTAGDESPQTTTTDSHNVVKRSWWDGALERLAPWAQKTSSVGPQPPSPPQLQPQIQNPPTPGSSEERKDMTEEQKPDAKVQLVRTTTESLAQRQRRILRLHTNSQDKEAGSQDQDLNSVSKVGRSSERSLDQPIAPRKVLSSPGQDQDLNPVSKVGSSSERSLDQPIAPRKVLSSPVSPNKSDKERKQQGAIRKGQTKEKPTAIDKKEAAASPQNDDTTFIRQQLQSLFEQVKALQVALEAKIALGQQSSLTRRETDTSPAAPTAPQNDKQKSSSKQPLMNRESTSSDPVTFRGLKAPFPKTHPGTHEYSQRAFNSSAIALCKIATELERMRSSAIAPIARHARDRLRVLVEDAKLEGDRKLKGLLGTTYKNWELLYAECRYSSSVSTRPDLLLKLKVVDINATSSNIWQDVKQLRQELRRVSPDIPRRPRIVLSPMKEYLRQARNHTEETKKVGKSVESSNLEKRIDGERLTRRIHTHSRWPSSSNDLNISPEDSDRKGVTVEQPLRKEEETPSEPGPRSKTSSTTDAKMLPKSTPDTVESSEQSLLEELFPEASSTPQPHQPEQSDRYPKLNLPDSTPIIRRELYDATPSLKEQVVSSFRKQGEQITVLQLTNCSTELTEADFRRIIPKSKHIEGWHRDGDLYKVVPGRDPLSLERLPFYYILFKNAEAALAYQKNASRLHKLSALHQPASIFSAIPPPKGFLEEGEDITAAISSYNLLPTHHPMSLNVLMQPYNPALRALVERGGYQPIAPSADEQGNHIWRVLMHVEGYEPTTLDLFKIFSRDAYKHGMTIPLRNESQTSIHRLRDLINLKTSSKVISSNRPRAYGTFDQPQNPESDITYDDPAIQSILAGANEDTPSQTSQLIMNRVYNRWVLDFEDEDTARRWSVRWHRRVLPELSHTKGAWKDSEEARICNTELLW